EYADGGTLFLDEIGEISESTQVKLLRLLQQREFERVGGNETISVDVRIVAATNKKLEAEVNASNFREDLFYRLKVVHLEVPPLRARRDDIPNLTRHFVSKFAAENDKRIDEIAPEVLETLNDYDWPGNVRELENVIERAVVVCPGDILEPHHLPDDFDDSGIARGLDIRVPGSSLDDVEKYVMIKTYEATGGSTKRTAEILGISGRKVQYKMNEYRDEGLEISSD
ncbi:MAG: sigma 54-interacting transcriptional regulator, partial [Bradymonadaceae bacterium]